MQNLINQLKALSDTNRFRIVMMLMERPLCVCELLQALDIAGGTLSNHLKILKNAGLINQRKDGRWIEYHLKEDASDLLTRITANRKGDFSQIAEDRRIIGKITREVCSTRKTGEKSL
jgi:ArsR family transcriptional regulator